MAAKDISVQVNIDGQMVHRMIAKTIKRFHAGALMDYSAAAREYAATIQWSPSASDHEKSLVLGNINGFASFLARYAAETACSRGECNCEAQGRKVS